jgi:GDP-L-fucose synthase
MKTLVIRPGNLYGPFDKFALKESKVIASLVRKAVEGKFPLEVWGNGEEIKDFIYIDDFIDGLISVFESYESFDIFNIASGKQITVNEIARIIIQQVDPINKDIIHKSGMPSMIPKRLININKIVSRTSWKPSTNLETGLRRTIDWYSEIIKNSLATNVDK